MDHMLSHKTNLNKFESIDIIQNMFSDHNGIKLDIYNYKLPRKLSNIWKFLDDPWVKEEVKREMKMHLGTKIRTQHTDICGV